MTTNINKLLPVVNHNPTEADRYLKELDEIKKNPGLVVEWVYGKMVDASRGKFNIPNPTNPFSYLLEASIMNMVTLHNAHENFYRNMYPRLANQYSHLYHHMFDEHYLGRFATPGYCYFDIYLNRQDVLEQLAKQEENEIKRLIIPRGSHIVGLDFTFTLLYDIEIKQLKHGGIDIMYRVDQQDPVQPLASNIVKWGYVQMGENEYFRLKVKLLNVKVAQLNDNLIATPSWVSTYPLKDRYCHCRVYHLINGEIKEMKTTHSDLVYDPYTPTARLTYLENKLKVEIPPIYRNNNTLGTQIYIEIYTTAGDVEVALNELGSDVFQYQWGQLHDLRNDAEQVEPLAHVNAPIILASALLQGGSNGETFEQTRDRVINFASYVKTPITPNQLETSLRIGSYEILKSRDTLTSRSYLATRALPANLKDTFTAGCASAMETIKITLEELSIHEDVRDNGRRMTITPEMLFKTSDGIISVVKSEDNPKKQRNKFTQEEYIEEVNKLQYMWTPFYYVLDPTLDTFRMRAYYMDKPEVENQVFLAHNETSGFSVSTDSVYIEKFVEEEQVKGSLKKVKSEGYKIRVKTVSTKHYQDLPLEKLVAQLAIKPKGEKHYAHVNGKLLGYGEALEEDSLKEHVWEFTLKTKWDVSEENGLVIHDLYMYLNEPRRFEVDLEGEFVFLYGVKDNPVTGHVYNQVDRMLNREIIPNEDGVIGITADKISYRLGWHLKNFWTNGIVVQNQIKYKRHERDVPRVYTRDVYKLDANGLYEINNNKLVVLHKAGSPVLDDHGQPLMKYRKGEVVLDERGIPVIEEDRKLTRLLDIMMIDGIYYFADHETDVYYRQMIGETVKNYITLDLEDIRNRLLENTLMFFYPKRTMGDAKLIIDGGLEVEEPMRMSFKVIYYMDEAHHNDGNLREALSEMTSTVINELLTHQQVSTSTLISTLRQRAGEDIVSVHVDMFGYSKDRKFTTYTSEDPSVRCSVKRILRQQADNRLKVVEDIDISYIKHDVIEELRRQRRNSSIIPE